MKSVGIIGPDREVISPLLGCAVRHIAHRYAETALGIMFSVVCRNHRNEQGPYPLFGLSLIASHG